MFVIFGALYLKFTLLLGLFFTTCSRGIFLGDSSTLLFTQVPGGGGTWSCPNEDFTMEKLLFGGGGGGVVRGGEAVKSLGSEELKTWAKDVMPLSWIPRKVVCVDSIPRNAMGKVNKKTLVKQMFP